MGNPGNLMSETPQTPPPPPGPPRSSFRSVTSAGPTGSPRPASAATPAAPAEPPVAPTRVAVLKANYRQAWLYFLMIISLVIAWGIPAQYFLARYFSFRPAETGPRNSTVFAVLAYEGISEDQRDVTPQRFREQFVALRKAGYQPVSLDEVHAFYTEGTRLPGKALLMTFDQSRKSSYFDVRKLLRRAGWPAVLFLWTLPIEREDPAALRWPYVRSLIRSGAWDIGAQSHRGFDQIVADNDGTLRNFMTAPQWFPAEMRYETPVAFGERLRADHDYVRTMIERETGERPKAFAFPYGDFGQYDERAVLSRRLNLDLVGALYDLGFIYASTALNTGHSDPRRLNRLLVRPEWTAEELLARLDNSWPRQHGITDAQSLTEPKVWLDDWGQVSLENHELHLQAAPEGTGAKAWINGTDLYGDFHARFKLKIRRGQVGFHFRATIDGEQHVYLGLGDTGDVWLRQKHTGLPAFTLASARFSYNAGDEVLLEVKLRGPHFTATVDGQNLFQDIINLRGEIRPGLIGLSVWDPQPGVAAVDFVSVEAEPVETSVLTWVPAAQRESSLAAWLQRNAVSHTHFAPPWYRIASRTRTEQFGWDANFYRKLARTYSMKWTPEIIPDVVDAQDDSLPRQITAAAVEMGAHGILCNLSELDKDIPLSRVTAWIQRFHRILQEAGLELMIRLSPEWERESTVAALQQSLPGIQFAFGDRTHRLLSGTRAGVRQTFARLVVANFPPDDATAAYPLTGGDSLESEWQSEVRGKLLRQEGLDAFRAGKFDLALEVCRRWSELEPYNEEPFRLMGDIHLRRGDVEPALTAYRNSLDLNPGQIGLVTHSARLLDYQLRKPAEAEALLGLYARLFPENTDIKLARAELYLRNERRDEAGTLVREVVRDNPGDLGALAMLHGLLGSPRERIKNLQAILDVSRRPGMEPHFAQAIVAHDLMLWPESWMLMPFIEDQAAIEKEKNAAQGPYQRLVPRETIVNEMFGLRRMSTNWVAYSDAETPEGQTLLLAAGPSTAEATLRLANSETMASGFIEVIIGEARGDFWIYARRGEGSMVRFGFQQAGRMYLQIWHRGEMINNQMRPWNRVGEVSRLRLEIRGDAAYGFVDGEPAFGAPVMIPSTMGLGWWGVSPWAAQFGLAQVVIREISGGPVPVTIAMFRARPEEWTDAEIVNAIRNQAGSLQAVAPPWFIQERDGRVRWDARGTFSDVRLISRFHRIRLLPMIRSVTHRNLSVADLVTLAAEQKVDGFTLIFARMPDDAWFAEAEEKLIGTGVSLLAMRIREDQSADVREICPHVGIFPGRRAVRTYPVIDMQSPPEFVGPMPLNAAGETGMPEETLPRSDLILYF